MKAIKKTKTTVTRKAKTAEAAVAPVTVNENKISVALVRPEAKRVYLAGTFNNWTPEATPMNSDGKGRWTTGLEVTPGRYEYLFVVDGLWMPDPNAREAVQNPFGGVNSILTVSA